MRSLIRTNDLILMNFMSVLLKDAGIETVEFDAATSAMEGSVGVLPRRLAVSDEDWEAARRVVQEAGLGEWLEGP